MKDYLSGLILKHEPSTFTVVSSFFSKMNLRDLAGGKVKVIFSSKAVKIQMRVRAFKKFLEPEIFSLHLVAQHFLCILFLNVEY